MPLGFGRAWENGIVLRANLVCPRSTKVTGKENNYRYAVSVSNIIVSLTLVIRIA